jgi:protein O-mannosyl-transferase
LAASHLPAASPRAPRDLPSGSGGCEARFAAFSVRGKILGSMSSRGPEKTSPRAKAAGSAPRGRATLVHLLVLAGVSFALYGGTLRDGFVLDDNLEVLQDRLIRKFADIPSLFIHNVWYFSGDTVNNYYRPLKTLFYAIEYHLFRFDPVGWHLTNILFNTAAVIAVYLLVRALVTALPPRPLAAPPAAASHSTAQGSGPQAANSPSPPRAGARADQFAFLTALFFAFHPIHVEAVAWIAAGNDLECGLALFLALWLYHRARVSAPQPPRLRDYLSSVVLFFAALLAKETALTFPAVILSYDFFYRGESLRQMLGSWRRYLAYFAALAVYLGARVYALSGFAPRSNLLRPTLEDMVLSVPVLAVQYLRKMLVPINLRFWHPFRLTQTATPGALGAILVVLCVVAAMFLLRRRQPLLSFALAWFWLTLIPALDIPKLAGGIVFNERYLYIPSLGFCIFGAWAWLWLRSRAASPAAAPAGASSQGSRGAPSRQLARLAGAWLAGAGLLALLGFYAAVILRRLPDWRSDISIATKSAAQSPGYGAPQAYLAVAYEWAGRLPEALEHLQRAVAIEPRNPFFRSTLGGLLLDLDRYDEAEQQLERAVQIDPRFPPLWLNLSTVYNAKKDWAKSIEACRRGLAIDPNNPREPYNYLLLTQLGLALWKSGQHAPALDTYHRAIELDPDRLKARFMLAISLAGAGQYDAATEQLVAGLRGDPGSPDAYLAHYELGGIYQIKQRWQDAELEYEEALQGNPGYTPARAELELVRTRLASPAPGTVPGVPAVPGGAPGRPP